MDLGLFTIDPAALQQFFATNSTTQIVLFLLANIGWIVFVGFFIFLFFFYLEDYKEGKATANWRWVTLAIDIPALNVQTPKAVEQLFAHLAGAYDPPNFADRFRHGHKQRWFSFEIISIEGYIQFIVWTEAAMQDLVEAAIYAQYPEAEIVEVEDYTKDFPSTFPNDQYELWASDFTLAEHQAFPIRTYEEFEHNVVKDDAIKDPMGTFLESFSRIGRGEHFWFQIIIQPTGNSWKEDSIKKIKEMMGEKSEGGKSPLGFLTDNAISKELGASAQEIVSQLGGGAPGEGAESGGDKKDDKPVKLTPGQNKLIEAMEKKISKLGFKTKMRAVYIAEKSVFTPSRAVNAIIGAVNQYNNPTSNSIVPSYGVSAAYALKNYISNNRKMLLMKAYRKRKANAGAKPFVFNIEELATVWHFPLSHVKTPLLEKASGKRAEPPTGLPIGEVVAEQQEVYRPDAQDEYHASGGDYSSEQHFG